MTFSDPARQERLAHTLAQAYARMTLESLGEWANEEGWYDVSGPDFRDSPEIQLSLEYMESCGLLLRHPEHPGWVRLTPAPDTPLATPLHHP